MLSTTFEISCTKWLLFLSGSIFICTMTSLILNEPIRLQVDRSNITLLDKLVAPPDTLMVRVVLIQVGYIQLGVWLILILVIYPASGLGCCVHHIPTYTCM